MENPKQSSRTSLSIKNISKTFDNKKVLDNIYLDIKQKEFICFLGPSGCGKTTLLRIIAGLEKADTGDIVMFDKNINDLPITKRNLGIVFQSYALFPNLSARQNIQYGMGDLSKAERIKLSDELLAVIGMTEKAELYPTELSGGQQQRVALARAMAVNPKILLLDEPLSALDKNIRNTLRLEIKRLHRKFGLTTIMVTHDQEEAMTMADKIVVMNNSKIEQIGTPQQIYNHPATQFVADFIGNMSFLPKQITGMDKTVAIRDEDCVVMAISDLGDGAVGIVEAIDFTGGHNRLHINTQGFILTAIIKGDKLRGATVSIGDKVKICLPRDKWHIYE